MNVIVSFEEFDNKYFLIERVNIHDTKTNIKKVVIWVGKNPETHGERIKVSNIANKFDNNNCFVITIPKLEIKGAVNESLITTKVMNKLFEFIRLNSSLITIYLDGGISTVDFRKSIIPVN